MLVPFVSAITLIVFQLPLWGLSNLGIPGLGKELNGFLVPSVAGWGLIAGIVWLGFFWLFHRRLKRTAAAGSGNIH